MRVEFGVLFWGSFRESSESLVYQTALLNRLMAINIWNKYGDLESKADQLVPASNFLPPPTLCDRMSPTHSGLSVKMRTILHHVVLLLTAT